MRKGKRRALPDDHPLADVEEGHTLAQAIAHTGREPISYLQVNPQEDSGLTYARVDLHARTVMAAAAAFPRSPGGRPLPARSRELHPSGLAADQRVNALFANKLLPMLLPDGVCTRGARYLKGPSKLSVVNRHLDQFSDPELEATGRDASRLFGASTR